MSLPDVSREAIGELPNPLGLEGLEFVEYATHQPQALGQVLEQMGFHPVARHRSREVLLYRQGGMNVVVDAHDAPADEPPSLAAFALRVRDAAAAHRRALERGAWPVPVEVAPMELHIPAIHGVGRSRIYFVDRWRDFSIWDVDFVPIPGADAAPPALAGLHWFGLVQYIGVDRMTDWCAFYEELFGWRPVPDTERYGILPRGRLLRSPCGLMLQLIEPDADAATFEHDEYLQRVGFGTPDVLASVAALHARGVEFVESPGLHSGQRGALTQARQSRVMFELVQHRS
jgi:4-hydroxyphenylpyruvate dioxygenase